LWNSLDLLDATVVGNQLVSNLIIPEVQADQVSNQMWVHTDEFSSQDSSGIEIGSVWFKAFIITKDL
jgi:hypothetical protein